MRTAHVQGVSHKTQILIVDDHAIVRAGLKSLLNDQDLSLVRHALHVRRPHISR